MASITVLGAQAQTVTLSYSASANVALAQNLASAITAAVTGGTLQPFSSVNGPPPPLLPGTKGEYVAETAGVTFLPQGYDAVVINAPATVFSSGDNGESVLAGSSGMNFIATGGSGSVAAGGGNNQITITPTTSGPWLLTTGDGNDTVFALGVGNDTVQAGGGHNSIVLGAGNNMVQSTGADTVFASGGSATIDASLAQSTYVQGTSGRILFLGGAGPATVLSGDGSGTIIGGSGNLLAKGGNHGNDLMFAGTGQATLFGGGDGDQLYAQGSLAQALHAGSGNETLSAFVATGADTLYGGSGNTQMIGGFGSDTFVAGAGAATMTSGASADLFTFINGQAGGTDLVIGFGGGDLISLQGYSGNAVHQALATQATSGGSVTITLQDHTTVTFAGLTSLTQNNFQ